MLKKRFVYIWEYLVKETYLSEFEKAYGPEGDWVQLFKRASGYIATDLHQDDSNRLRFLTVDSWETKKDRDDFLNNYSKEFENLDTLCERFTEQEKWLGDFENC